MIIREMESDELYDIGECFEYLIDPETNKEFDMSKLEMGLVHQCKYDVYNLEFVPLGIKDKEVYGVVMKSEMEFIADVVDPKTNGVTSHKITISNDPFDEDNFPTFTPGQLIKLYRVWDVDKKDPITYLDLKRTGLNMLLFDEHGEFIVLPSVANNRALFGENYRASLTLSESDNLKSFIDAEKGLSEEQKNCLQSIVDNNDRDEDDDDDDEWDDGDDGWDDEDDENSYFETYEPFMIIGLTQFNQALAVNNKKI